MILWASPEYTYALPPLTNWIAFYQSACPKADIVLCGQYPLADGVQTAANQMTLNYAMQYNVAYFDGETPFENYSNWAARGFGSGDGTHGSAAGYAAYGYLLSRFLGLNCLWLP
jgi:hypothetical protein